MKFDFKNFYMADWGGEDASSEVFFSKTLTWNSLNAEGKPQMAPSPGQYADKNCATLISVKITGEEILSLYGDCTYKWTATVTEAYHSYVNGLAEGDNWISVKLRIEYYDEVIPIVDIDDPDADPPSAEFELAGTNESDWKNAVSYIDHGAPCYVAQNDLISFNGSLWGPVDGREYNGAAIVNKLQDDATVSVNEDIIDLYAKRVVKLCIHNNTGDGYGGYLFEDAEIEIDLTSSGYTIYYKTGGQIYQIEEIAYKTGGVVHEVTPGLKANGGIKSFG